MAIDREKLMTQSEYTIQELSELTGLPRRTIHFYVQQEIIPPPEGAGLGAYYTDDHLLRLKLVPLLRQQGLRLDDIREKFRGTADAKLGELYEQSNHKIPAPPPAQPARQNYVHYQLTAGILLMAPAGLSPLDRQRL
ncbi:MAG: MerR family transcriptional regulator, partial [Anaerolineales bacterium]|nr:MerR family transcriptional regulator [Anaerolineales bacterium]